MYKGIALLYFSERKEKQELWWVEKRQICIEGILFKQDLDLGFHEFANFISQWCLQKLSTEKLTKISRCYGATYSVATTMQYHN